jgi:protein-tyrosine phosphatase
MLSIFSRKKIQPFPFDRLITDMHSHMLPGIDDGSPDVETSVQLIQGLINLGYSNFITTPHVMEDLYPNNPESIGNAFNALKSGIDDPVLAKKFRFAAEYLLDGNVDMLLEKKEPLLTIKDRLVLVEISFASPPLHLREILFQLQISGYQPVFAHPERYGFYHQNPKEYAEIKATGCLFQSNLLSFSGYYGAAVKQAAEYLVQKGLIDLLGTDMHHEKHLQNLQELSLTPALGKLLDDQGVMNHALW